MQFSRVPKRKRPKLNMHGNKASVKVSTWLKRIYIGGSGLWGIKNGSGRIRGRPRYRTDHKTIATWGLLGWGWQHFCHFYTFLFYILHFTFYNLHFTFYVLRFTFVMFYILHCVRVRGQLWCDWWINCPVHSNRQTRKMTKSDEQHSESIDI